MCLDTKRSPFFVLKPEQAQEQRLSLKGETSGSGSESTPTRRHVQVQLVRALRLAAVLGRADLVPAPAATKSTALSRFETECT